jgi:hypothetical protein
VTSNNTSGRRARMMAGAMLMTAAAIVGSLLGATAPAAAAPESYVAVAVGLLSDAPPVGSVGGYSIDPDQNKANQAALSDCVNKGGHQCVVTASAQGGCAAAASNDFGETVGASYITLRVEGNTLYSSSRTSRAPTLWRLPAPRGRGSCRPRRRRCLSHRKNGAQCRNWAIRGGVVCRYHGGSAPQVLAKAQENIALAADHNRSNVQRLADEADSEQVRLQASNTLIDRALGKPTTTVELGPKTREPYEDILANLGGVGFITREESRARRGLRLWGLPIRLRPLTSKS